MPDIAQYQKKCALRAPLVKILGLYIPVSKSRSFVQGSRMDKMCHATFSIVQRLHALIINSSELDTFIKYVCYVHQLTKSEDIFNKAIKFYLVVL